MRVRCWLGLVPLVVSSSIWDDIPATCRRQTALTCFESTVRAFEYVRAHPLRFGATVVMDEVSAGSARQEWDSCLYKKIDNLYRSIYISEASLAVIKSVAVRSMDYYAVGAALRGTQPAGFKQKPCQLLVLSKALVGVNTKELKVVAEGGNFGGKIFAPPPHVISQIIDFQLDRIFAMQPRKRVRVQEVGIAESDGMLDSRGSQIEAEVTSEKWDDLLDDLDVDQW